MFRKKSNVFQKMKILLIENCLLKIDFWMNNQSKTIFFYNINNNNKFANFNLLYWPKISSKFPIPLIVWHSLFGQNNKWNFGIVHRVSNIDIVSKNLFNFIHKQYRLKKICLNGDDNAFGHRIFPTDSYIFVWWKPTIQTICIYCSGISLFSTTIKTWTITTATIIIIKQWWWW